MDKQKVAKIRARNLKSTRNRQAKYRTAALKAGFRDTAKASAEAQMFTAIANQTYIVVPAE